MQTITTQEPATSFQFQLARVVALSSAVAVAKVSPLICASSGGGVM